MILVLLRILQCFNFKNVFIKYVSKENKQSVIFVLITCTHVSENHSHKKSMMITIWQFFFSPAEGTYTATTMIL